MDKIVLQNMVFYGYHGVFPGEQELGQRFQVDVEIKMDLQPAGKADDLDLTIDYGQVFALIKVVVEKERYQLLEALGERIAARVLQSCPVEEVTVRVRKPWLPVEGVLDYAEVELVRRK